MLEVLTNSGATITVRDAVPEGLATAVMALGGEVIRTEGDPDRETVLTIMDQGVIGTTLTDESGLVYELQSSGWIIADDYTPIPLPPYETIIAATMPGGWSWSA